MKKYKFLLLLLFPITLCCKNGTTSPVELKENNTSSMEPSKAISSQKLNISLLLDLSDRINPQKYPNPAMEYYQRDAGYINLIAKAFVNHIERKKIILIDDKIQLFFEPEPSNRQINEISQKLKVHLTRQNVTKEKLKELRYNYEQLPKKIYELAIADDNYVGSDTWRFMKNNVKDYCVDNGYRNILIILTDGYMYHKDDIITEGNKTTFLTPELIRQEHLNDYNWQEKYDKDSYGFISATKNINNLEVLILGINPDPKNDFEDDVIKKYWNDWLQNMGIKHSKIHNADLPSNMEKMITDFIQS